MAKPRFGIVPTDGIVGAILADPADPKNPFQYYRYSCLQQRRTPDGSILPDGNPAKTGRAIAQCEWDAEGANAFRRIAWDLMCLTKDRVGTYWKRYYFVFQVEQGTTTEYLAYVCRNFNRMIEPALRSNNFESTYLFFLDRFPNHIIRPRYHVYQKFQTAEQLITRDDWRKIHAENWKADETAKVAAAQKEVDERARRRSMANAVAHCKRR